MIAYAAEGLIYADNSLDVSGNVFINRDVPDGIGIWNRPASVVADVSCNAFDGVPAPVLGAAHFTGNVLNGPLPRCVPEPSTMAVMLAALAMLATRRRVIWQARR